MFGVFFKAILAQSGQLQRLSSGEYLPTLVLVLDSTWLSMMEVVKFLVMVSLRQK